MLLLSAPNARSYAVIGSNSVYLLVAILSISFFMLALTKYYSTNSEYSTSGYLIVAILILQVFSTCSHEVLGGSLYSSLSSQIYAPALVSRQCAGVKNARFSGIPEWWQEALIWIKLYYSNSNRRAPHGLNDTLYQLPSYLTSRA